MIGYLRGEVIENSDGRLLVAVGGAAGAVGYAVQAPASPAYEFLKTGQSVELFIHTHVREEALDLYGFLSRTEKELFLTLLTVSGIGPKVAVGLLSKVEPPELIRAVMDGDKDALTQLPGIGKKTAERMVLELKDAVRKKVEEGYLILPKTVTAPAGATSGRGAVGEAKVTGGNQLIRDARDALLGLGYREQEVNALLQRVVSELAEPPKRVEEIIRSALQQLG